ncbi:MAG: TraR/DksA C4-type zinc finger protein [Gallionellaceae bacterium]|nr:TraR/DksA C4-type zinc finger protein [Gallionellaceae bacterium]MDD5365356.1 TraR/DksA C4-type zinc finger protein [Gallionellaceae bacterium]
MRHYTKQDIKAVREALTNRLNSLTEHIRSGLSESEQHQFTAILGRGAGDSSDEALAISLGDLSAARLDLDIRQWQELKAAEQRLDAPGFGECAECGTAIPVARLMANPAACRCIACQTAFEHSHAGQARGSL